MGLTQAVGIAALRSGANVINPMRQRHRDDILNDTAYIFNITNFTWSPIYRTHGVTVVVGNEAVDRVPEELIGKVYEFGETDKIKWSRITVHGRIELVEAGIESSRGVTYREESTEAHEIAQDITNHCNENRPGLESGVPGFSGIFWSKNPEPTSKELKDAQKKLFTYYHALVEEGDKIYTENLNNSNPTKDRPETMMKVAFKTLKSAGKLSGDKPWVFDPTPLPATEACPSCGSAVPPKALRCKSCLAFLSTDKALLRQYYPAEFPLDQPKPTPPVPGGKPSQS
jgi:hypothetical protein